MGRDYELGEELGLFRSFGEGQPVRLFIGGLHGEEHKFTDPVLEKFADKVSRDDCRGRIIICSLGGGEGEYITTLDKEYYESEVGKKLLSLINQHQPSTYVELHSYSNYSSLTNQNRIEESGVPPLVDLGSRILAGSVSPILRKKFQRNDFCFLLDIPKEIENEKKLLKIMAMIARSSNREEIVKKLDAKFPKQTEEMVKNYVKFYKGKLI